jgi:hypothetical protein
MTAQTIALVTSIAANLLAIAHVLDGLKWLDGVIPAKFRPIFLGLLAGLPPLGEALMNARSGEAIALAVASGVTAFFMAYKGKTPPSGGASAPVGQLTHISFEKPPEPPTAAFWAPALVCLMLCGCSVFTRQTAKTVVDIAHDLCVKHYSGEKPGISIKDVEDTYCKDLDPWISTILGAEVLGAAKARAAHP